MNADVKRWVERDGPRFLRQIGAKEGQELLDFGSGEGHYALPAAKVVGRRGKVYAVERDDRLVVELRQLLDEYGISNVVVIHSDSPVDLPSDSIDIALCYDVIHFADQSGRKRIYAEIRRVLREQGQLSVYPKHRQNDEPLMELAHSDLQAVIREIECEGFVLESKSIEELMHDDYYNKGYVLNFRKGDRAECPA
ncbi:MAG: class I SAM-dependent methyltransferase [Candidatus Eisenbacteria sp.]|nr:class I SAM-dependent methyltransferase [Candidatus Eisenbacteria bacterium]